MSADIKMFTSVLKIIIRFFLFDLIKNITITAKEYEIIQI